MTSEPFDRENYVRKPIISGYHEWNHLRNGTSWRQQIRERMKTLFDTAIPYFGINIDPEELAEKFKWKMDSERNRGAVKILAQLEEKRVEQIEAAEAERIQELRKNHSSLFKKIDELDDKTTETYSEDSPDSDSETVLEETSERESKADKYMTDSKEFDSISDDTISDDSET